MIQHADGWTWKADFTKDGCSECDAHCLSACHELRSVDCSVDFIWKRHVKISAADFSDVVAEAKRVVKDMEW